MSTRVIDTTSSGWNTGDVNNLKAADVHAVIGYVAGGGGWKHLPSDMVTTCKAAGIGVASVYEATADDMSGGAGAGAAHALALKDANAALGLPARGWFAEDTDTSDYASCMAYMDGAASVLGAKNVGGYGSGTFAAMCVSHGYKGWEAQSRGWSGGGVVQPGVSLYQLMGQPYGSLGMDYDGNDCFDADIFTSSVTPLKVYVGHMVVGALRDMQAFRKLVESKGKVAQIRYVPGPKYLKAATEAAYNVLRGAHTDRTFDSTARAQAMVLYHTDSAFAVDMGRKVKWPQMFTPAVPALPVVGGKSDITPLQFAANAAASILLLGK